MKKHCPINGGWGKWKNVGACSRTCAIGVQKQVRSCDNPYPKYGGKNCVGDTSQLVECKKKPCPVDGKWGKWYNISSCSRSCGAGEMKQKRDCIDPKHGGAECKGNDEQVIPCNIKPCPIDGKWGGWEAVGSCSVTCGTGQVTEKRECNQPVPAHGGKDCKGEDKRETKCEEIPCPINGGWSDWMKDGECSVSCGEGVILNKRVCNKPEPQNGGDPCKGEDEKNVPCTEAPCPIDGGWGNWKSGGGCSVSCGEGVTLETRECDNPKPQYGGEPCKGENEKNVPCNTAACPINGGWGEWTSAGGCSVSCGGGVALETRECDNPEPQHGGDPCKGKNEKTVPCTEAPCPIDGGWGEWKSGGGCSVSCGEGVALETRECDNPKPQYGGNICKGDDQQYIQCTAIPCPVDGIWGIWKNVTSCSVSCGGGLLQQKRLCTPPENGGKNCIGNETRDVGCNSKPCPLNGGWGIWSEWGNCSRDCGENGEQTRMRICDNPVPDINGKPCEGDNQETRKCEGIPACDIDGGWGFWTDWDECSDDCFGTQKRRRLCNNPVPKGSGKQCDGQEEEKRICDKLLDCPGTLWKVFLPMNYCDKHANVSMIYSL